KKGIINSEDTIEWLEEVLIEDDHPYQIELSTPLSKSLFNKLQSGIKSKYKEHEKIISMSSLAHNEERLFLDNGFKISFIKNLKEKIYDFLELGNSPFDFLLFLKLHPYTLLKYNNDLVKLSFHKLLEVFNKLFKDIALKEAEYNSNFILLNTFIIHTLFKEESKGNTYITFENLISKIKKYNESLCFEEKFGIDLEYPLHISLDEINPIETIKLATKPEKETIVSYSIKDGSLYNEPDTSYIVLDYNYLEELGIRYSLEELKKKESLFKDFPNSKIQEDIKKLEEQKKFSLESNQLQAVVNSIFSNFSLIVGGPGTGKTTIVQFVIELAELYNINTLLCAPTGTAAKRMSEVTGRKASTIHRALKYKPFGGFEINALNPLPEGTLVIVDESSMLDLHLGKTLLEACRKSQVILVGDINQLPPVGSGEVLKNILLSKNFKTSQLTKIFRQALDNPIVDFSYKIKNNIDIKEFNKFVYKRGDINKIKNCLIYCQEDYEYHTDIEEIILNKVSNIIKENKEEPYQILVSTNKANLTINKVAQSIYNPDGKTIYINDLKQHLKTDDKIMQIKNNYEYSIFNGSIGRIINKYDNWETLLADTKNINKDLLTEFNNWVNYVYSKPKLIRKYKKDFCLIYFNNIGFKAISLKEIEENIKLSYSMTIHKSQGQEFDKVIMAISSETMGSREIIYTGATRAKQNLITVTTPTILEKSKEKSQDSFLKRFTLLEKMILFF
ncbi:AAA family ATPase, partial [bacterium]|nr:AAA family ATPase [bacterium]